LLYRMTNKAYIYTNHKSTSISQKSHLYMTNDTSKSVTKYLRNPQYITYKPHIQKYTLFQVHKCNT
jgi:hypothetical protein